jgi:hypothetical protein
MTVKAPSTGLFLPVHVVIVPQARTFTPGAARVGRLVASTLSVISGALYIIECGLYVHVGDDLLGYLHARLSTVVDSQLCTALNVLVA